MAINCASNIIWYWSQGGDGKLTAGLVEVTAAYFPGDLTADFPDTAIISSHNARIGFASVIHIHNCIHQSGSTK